MRDSELTARNVHLTEMLRQAGLDAEARDVTERIQRVLTDELHHRMKNMLAMVAAIVRQTMRTASNLQDAEAAIGARLVAMAKAHDLLLKADWKSAGLQAVLKSAVAQHDTAAGRIAVTGWDMLITSSAILPLTLALNELCTNAVKYGALSNDAGRVDLTCRADDKTVTILWAESAGPPVHMPQRKGLGSTLIESALPRQLGGTGQLIFAPSGISFTLSLPRDRLQPETA
ncbi:MAG TPA: sensor histidine kinase [Rhizomicrobium sp.]|nr:sensor histidine kinase [Rhizomicrobium sp.]